MRSSINIDNCSDEYLHEMKKFYIPYFQNEEDFSLFQNSVFECGQTSVRMFNQVQRFISLSKEIDQIQPGVDSLKILFVRICIESLLHLSKIDKKDFWSFFEQCFSNESKEYIVIHFKKYSCNDNTSEPITISDFLCSLKTIRDNVVHEGDCWTNQIFTEHHQSPIHSDFHPQNKEPFHSVSSMDFESFIKIITEACIEFISRYCNNIKNSK